VLQPVHTPSHARPRWSAGYLPDCQLTKTPGVLLLSSEHIARNRFAPGRCLNLLIPASQRIHYFVELCHFA
jgi:hypothetical protein